MRLKTEEVAPFVSEVLFDEGRDRPVVALTTDPRTGHSLVDVHRIVREVGDRAIVVELETGDATWALSEALPPRLDVYGGAARIWWPGLTPGANPYDHRLYFVYSDEDARRVEEHLLSAVDGSTGDAPAPNDAPLHPVAAVVSKVEGERIEVTLGEQRGVVVEADLPLGIIAGCMKVGVEVEVWQLEQAKDDVWKCSIAGLLPDSWQVLKSSVRVGDVLMGRAQNVLADKGLVFVDVLPGAVGVCHISELHFDHVRDMSEYIESGEIVAFEVLAMDFAEMRLQLSRKRAFTRDAGPSPSLVPGGAPFVWTQGMPLFESLRRKAQRGEGRRTRLRVVGQQPTQQGRLSPDAAEQVESLTAELQAAIEQRANLVKEIRSLREQVGQAKKDLRSAEDRFDNLARKTSSEVDPLSSGERSPLPSASATRGCTAKVIGRSILFGGCALARASWSPFGT